VRITQDVNDSNESFSIDMLGRPTANHLANFEFDEDKALLLFYENSHDHVADLIQNLDDAAPGVETHVAKEKLSNTLEEMKITPSIQRAIQQRFNSLHDKNGLIIGCCCCGCTTILPTVSESGIDLPPPILSIFPTDPKFNPLKFSSEELDEFNDQHVLMKQVRSSMAANNNSDRYHVHQELLRTIISEPIDNSNTESTSTPTTDDESPIHTTETNVVMEDVLEPVPIISPDEFMDNVDNDSDPNLEVTEEIALDLEGYICEKCDAQLSIGKIPTYSVAKLDFGLLSRLNELPPGVSDLMNEPLPELNPIEKLLIARHRPLAVTLKLSPGGTGPDGYIGHIITFVHRGPETLLTTLPRVDNDINARIHVQFIGRRGLPEDTNTFLRHVPEACVRPHVVIRYLKILKVINPHYADIIIDDSHECLESMRLLPDRIFAERQVINDAGIIQLDLMAVGNPAESIHQSSQDGQPQDMTEDDSNGNTYIHPVSMDSVFFNPRNGDASIAITSGREMSDTERIINSIRNIGEELQGVSTDERVVEEELLPQSSTLGGSVRLQVPRNQDPVNEFTSNDELFYAAFPITFPLGHGLRKPGSVPKNDALHMLRQHSRTVVKEPMVIFTLFNQDQRHSVVRSIAAKVRADSASFDRFSTIVNAPNFQSRCDEAARNPNGTVAKQLLRDILPLVRVSGANVPFGPVERARAACDLYANCRRFGLPTFFFTLAPDYRDPLTLRLGISRPIFSGFPYNDGKDVNGNGGYQDALHTWDINGRPCNTIYETEYKITTSHLQDIVRKNATAQAVVYMSMLKAVFEGLLGISMDEHIKKSIPLSSRRMGIFGRTRAASLSTECQGRGTLHGHCLSWVELTPQVLQRLAGRETFSEQISSILDTMVISSLEITDHITSALNDKLPPVNVWRPDHNFENDRDQDEYKKYIASNMKATQIHSHSDTCKKGSHGDKHCRLGFKRVSALCTGPIELELVQQSDGTAPHTVNVLPAISEWRREVPDYNIAGLPTIDPRTIYWATKRPLFQYSHLFNEDGELLPDLESIISDDTVVEKLRRLSENEKRQFAEEISKRNCYLVETSPTAALLLCCNTNAQVLGATEQAKGVVQYLVNYITKHSAPLAVVASLVAAARRHTIRFPSTAEDGATELRQTKYLVTRVINNITGMSEVSTCQAAGSLMGLLPMTSTQYTQYCFIKGAINFQQSLQHNDSPQPLHDIESDNDEYDDDEQSLDNEGDITSLNDMINDDDIDIGDVEYDNENDDNSQPMDVDIGIRQSVTNIVDSDDNNSEHIHQDQNLGGLPADGEYNNGLGLEGFSTAISDLVINDTICDGIETGMAERHEREGDEYAGVYTIEGVHTPICPFTHYRYRGYQLRHMNYVEYFSIVKISKIPPGQVDDGTTSTTTRRGRQSNKTFLFDEGHPLFRLYRQQLRSKQATPILAGYPPPSYPGDMTVPSTRLIRNDWKKFATYYLTAFCPWNVETGRIPYTFDFRGFSDFVRTTTTRRFLDRARNFLMESTIRVLQLKQKNLIAITHYRFSNADRRVGNRFEGPSVNDRNNNNDTNNDNGEEDRNLALVLELIRAEARQDDISELTSSVGDLNAISVRDALRSVMGENVINNDTDQSAGENSSSTTQENPVFTMTNNQALNVLNSIRLNPTAPRQVQTPNQQARDVEGLNIPIALEHDAIMHVPPGDLNEKQLAAYLRCNEYLQSLARGDALPPLILIHGAPGTGKSFIVEKVVHRADELGIGTVSCAFTGSAATNLLHGMTILSMLGIPMTAPSKNEDLPILSNPVRLLAIRNLFKYEQSDQVRLLFIDEISLVTPVLFSMLNKRLKQIFENNLPFGGLSVILLGDFQQLDPIGCKSMSDAVIEHLVHNRRSNMYTIGSPREDGINLFISFVLVMLTQQQRAIEDVNHTLLLEQLRGVSTQCPITDDIITQFSRMVLTAQDVLDEPEWRHTPVAVCGNNERAELNQDQAIRYANDKGLQVIQWRMDLAGLAARFPSDITESIYVKKSSQLMFTFVQGAPAYITENMNALKSVVNGSFCELHSLTWTDRVISTAMQQLINNANRGEIVILPIPPDFINVRLDGVPNSPSDSLFGANDYVIPIPLARNNLKVKFNRQKIEAKVHAVELGFAVTYHKLQGKTLPRLIINPYKRGCIPEIDINALIVGFSRVRNSSHLRFLPIPSNAPACPWRHLKQLKSNDNFRIWMAGFNENGEWIQPLALQASLINRQRTNHREHGATIPTSVRETTTSNTPQRQTRTRCTPQTALNGNATTQTTAGNQQNTLQHQSTSRTTGGRIPARTSNAETASPFFVPFLCAVQGYHHPRINDVKQYVTEEVWEIMIRRTQYVHQYVRNNGNNNEKAFINNWPWDLRHNNAPRYINAPAQERLLIFEELYMNMLQFPADCTHQLLVPGATCGHLLMQNFNDWNAA
jgi:hypothetical protein